MARDYAHKRKQFGTEIETFPAVRELLVESKVDLMAARALTYYASACVDELYGLSKTLEADDFADDDEKKKAKAELKAMKRTSGMLTPMAKYYGSEMCMRVANHSIAVMGGNGYMHDYPLERHLRDSRITTIYEGTTQLQIVAAVSAVVSGNAASLVEHLLDRAWSADLAPLAENVRTGVTDLNEVIKFVKDQPDANYRRLHARRIVDMAIVLIVGALFCNHAAESEARETVLKYWIETRMPEFRRNREMILSGQKLILSDFEALAGPAPRPEPAMA